MNLALHGFLLQVFVLILNLQHDSMLCSAGEPGYLDFDNLPETNFSCQGKVIGGYYADVEAGCQMFHVCTIGQKDEIMDIKFLCLNGTVFDQETRVCERVDEVDCSKSERFYNLNLELYGNNAVTLSLHENNDDDIDPSDSIDDHQQRTTSIRPTTTTTTTTTTTKPNKPSTTPGSSSFSHPTGYPQHFQPQPPFPQVHTSQSKSLYDDKNGGYHHQYIFHNGERNNNQQATSYQLFSNQGVSSTTVQPPQVHQIRFSSTSTPQIIHNEPSTVSPLFHATSSTIQTLLSNSANSPALINPIFHNHGIASTTEQFTLHNNNPRETSEYRESDEQNIRPLEAVQSTNKGKVSKLTISPVPIPSDPQRSVQTKISHSSQQQRISGNFLPTPATDETTVRSFYPTLRSVSKPTQSSQSTSEQVTQHIHVLPPVPVPQLKPHLITINLPPPDIQRIVQNPSPLLPSQSRVIVTAKASVSDESGRPLNTTQLVTLPLPTIPASYDDYKEGDESFDPFYRDVPKIRNARRVRVSRTSLRVKRSPSQTKNSMVSFVYGGNSPKRREVQVVDISDKTRNRENVAVDNGAKDFKSIKESLIKFRDILFGGEFSEDSIRSIFEGSSLQENKTDGKARAKGKLSLEDLEVKASKNFKVREYEDTEDESDTKESKVDDEYSEDPEIPAKSDTKESDAEEHIDLKDERTESDFSSSEDEDSNSEAETSSEAKEDIQEKDVSRESETDDEKRTEGKRVLDIVILDPNEHLKTKSSYQENIEIVTEQDTASTDIPILSTTEQTTESTSPTNDDLLKKHDSKDSKEWDDRAEVVKLSPIVDGKEFVEDVDEGEPSKTSKKVEDKAEKVTEEENKTDRPKERAERKPNAKRKSSRIRSFSGKISSRKKDLKIDETETQNDEHTKSVTEKVLEEKMPTTTPVVNSEIEQIDKHIFDEPESQTSKEIDIRAVGHRSGYAKSQQGGKDQNTGKDNRKGDVNEYEVLEKQTEDLKKDEEKDDKPLEVEEQSTISSLNNDEATIDEKSSEESDSVDVMNDNHSVEEKNYYKDESSIEHESAEEESATVVSKEDAKKDSEETPASHNVRKSSKRGKSIKFEVSSKDNVSHKRRKFSDEEEVESQEYSTIKSEEINSHEVSEYHDSTEAFDEGSHEVSTENDYTQDDSATSSENINSEDVPYSREETVEEKDEDESTASDQEDSTEGVLKFTDELPKEKKEEISDGKKSSESVENIAHDYVDDNYEPDNYKERESTDSNDLDNQKTNKKVEAAGESEEMDEATEKSKDSGIEIDLQQTTTPTTTSTTTTTTTTTTVRPTPPKLFKPISVRKSYNYIPPTTTPNPVVIKPRSSLLNPKPAKPPKSYNDFAPKPVIRKFPLLARKQTATVLTTTIRDEDSTEVTETPVTMTETPVAMTKAPVTLTTAPVTITEIPVTMTDVPVTITKAPVTITEPAVTMTDAPVTITDAPLTTTEASISDENVLEVKLDHDQVRSPANEPMQKDQSSVKNKGDQDSSSTEQKSPNNVKKDEEDLIKTTENFTPYPLSRLSTLTSAIQETAKEVLSTSTEMSTTPKNFTLIEVEILSTTVSPLATIPSEPDQDEATTIQTMPEEEVSTESSTKIIPTETSVVTESTTQSTTPLSHVSTSQEPEKVVSTTIRPPHRKLANLRRQDTFNCLEKEMYRFYGDNRDCRLFHYCSPGFTSRQVLDFRFVCEEGTTFDEESQSCKHDTRGKKCLNRQW